MKLYDVIANFLNRGEKSKEVPDGYCPNCWGTQEYGGQFYKAIKNENIDINTVSKRKGWIQDYAEKNLVGIKLKPHYSNLVCSKCKIKYQQSD